MRMSSQRGNAAKAAASAACLCMGGSVRGQGYAPRRRVRRGYAADDGASMGTDMVQGIIVKEKRNTVQEPEMIQHEDRQEKGKTQNAEQREGAAPLSSGTAQTESISG